MGIHAIEGVVEEILRTKAGMTFAGGVTTLTAPVLNSADINTPDIDGGSIDGVSVTGELLDSTTFIVDNVDTTKKLAFQLAGLTTATTRTLTPPDADDTIAALGAVQTITGAKTFADATLKLAGSSSGAATIKAAAAAGTAILTLPTATDDLVGRTATQTLTNKTLTSPVLNSATVADPVFSGLQAKGASPEAAGSVVTTTKLNTALADNTVADAFTVSVRNAVHGGAIRLTVTGTLGDGDSTDSKFYMIGISRIPGAATKAVISTATAVGATTGATANATTTASVTGMTGAVGATQTFTIQVKVARSAGASSGHVVVSEAMLLNGFATGIGIVAS